MTMNKDQSGDTDPSVVYGIAALSLLEAIILTLQSNGTLSSAEVDEAFDAAISAHQHRHQGHSASENALAATILNRLQIEGNSVRLDLRP